jgi:hypothetical protein
MRDLNTAENAPAPLRELMHIDTLTDPQIHTLSLSTHLHGYLEVLGMCDLDVAPIPLNDSNLATTRYNTSIIERNKPCSIRGEMRASELIEPKALRGLNSPDIATINRGAKHPIYHSAECIWHRHCRGYRPMLIDTIHHTPHHVSRQATPRSIMDQDTTLCMRRGHHKGTQCLDTTSHGLLTGFPTVD